MTRPSVEVSGCLHFITADHGFRIQVGATLVQWRFGLRDEKSNPAACYSSLPLRVLGRLFFALASTMLVHVVVVDGRRLLPPHPGGGEGTNQLAWVHTGTWHLHSSGMRWSGDCAHQGPAERMLQCCSLSTVPCAALGWQLAALGCWLAGLPWVGNGDSGGFGPFGSGDREIATRMDPLHWQAVVIMERDRSRWASQGR